MILLDPFFYCLLKAGKTSTEVREILSVSIKEAVGEAGESVSLTFFLKEVLPEQSFLELYTQSGQKLWEGIVDEQICTLSDGMIRCTVLARQKIGAYLTDNEVRPENHASVSLELLVALYASSYGLMRVQNGKNLMLYDYALSESMNIWALLGHFSGKVYGGRLFLNDSQSLVLTSGFRGGTHTLLKEEVIFFEMAYRPKYRISSVQSVGLDEKTYFHVNPAAGESVRVKTYHRGKVIQNMTRKNEMMFISESNRNAFVGKAVFHGLKHVSLGDILRFDFDGLSNQEFQVLSAEKRFAGQFETVLTFCQTNVWG